MPPRFRFSYNDNLNLAMAKFEFYCFQLATKTAESDIKLEQALVLYFKDHLHIFGAQTIRVYNKAPEY